MHKNLLFYIHLIILYNIAENVRLSIKKYLYALCNKIKKT